MEINSIISAIPKNQTIHGSSSWNLLSEDEVLDEYLLYSVTMQLKLKMNKATSPSPITSTTKCGTKISIFLT